MRTLVDRLVTLREALGLQRHLVADRATTVAALLVALLTALGLNAVFAHWMIFVVVLEGLVVWFVVTYATELRVARLPRIRFVFTNHSLTGNVARVAIRTTESSIASAVRVVLIDYRRDLSVATVPTVVERLLLEEKSGVSTIDLNQGETYYYRVAHKPAGGPVLLGPLNGAPDEPIPYWPLFVKIRVSGKDIETQVQFYRVGQSATGDLEFQTVTGG